MASLIVGTKFTATDSNGLPLAGGKVFTYLAGTLTPQATYTNQGGGTPNTNPVILDASGRASIWLDPSLTYRIIVKNSIDVVAPDGDVDNIRSADYLTGSLAAGAGSSLVGFLQSGTGAAARTVQAKLRDIVSVKDFGAVGDGTTDDTTAINAAITAARLVYMPPGTYKTTAAITIPDNTCLFGAGKGVTILKPVGAYTAAVLAQGTSFASWGQGRSLRSMSIDGSGGFTGIGLSCVNLGLRCYFGDLYILNVTGKGLYTQGCFDHTYERIESRANSGLGIHNFEKQTVPDGVYEESSKLIFNDCWAIANNSAGIQWQVDGGDTFTFNDCKPSEGTIGMEFAKNCFGHRIRNLMFDQIPGAGVGNGIAIRTNASFVQTLSIDGVQTYQGQYSVQVVHGREIHVANAFGAVTQVRSESTAEGNVYPREGISYSDARATPLTYPADDVATWTPTLNGAGSALGNGTMTATRTVQGHRVNVDIKLTLGSTSVIGAGFGFTLPIAAAADANLIGTCYDLSATTFYATQTYATGGNISMPVGAAFTGGTTPFTWATGDVIRVTGSYPIN